MSETPEIKDLPKLLAAHLNNRQLVSYRSSYLTKPGENYGSLMLSITANVKNSDGVIEELPLVAKLPPITNDTFWNIFQPEHTCVREAKIYEVVSPAIRELQLEAGIAENALFDGFSECYGCRISLDPAATAADRDAVLVLENLLTSGYKAGNRQKMFDLAHTQLLLRYMAKYHALTIALRIKRPELYDQKVRPHYHKFNMNDGFPPEAQQGSINALLVEVQLATNNNEKILDRVRELWSSYDEYFSQPNPADNLYTTIMHNDMWINNLMFQYDANGKPAKLKIVDFQIAQYESLAHDVVFMLFSSVETVVLEENMESLLQLYFQSFIDCLKSVGIPTGDYTLEHFLAEIKRVAPFQIMHALFMSKIILADNKSIPDDFKDLNMGFVHNKSHERVVQKIADILQVAQKFKYLY